MISVCVYLDYDFFTKNTRTSEKLLCVPWLLYLCARTYCPNCQMFLLVCTYVPHIIIWFNIQRHFCAILYVKVSNSGQRVNSYKNIFRKWNIAIYTTTHNHDSHVILYIIHLYILVWFIIKRNFWAILSAAPETILQNKTVTS